MGAAMSFFRAVACFFRNFSPIVGGWFKLVGAKMGRAMFAGGSIKATAVLKHMWAYCWYAYLKIVGLCVNLLFVLPLALLNSMFPGPLRSLRSLSIMLASCANAPRDWYLRQHEHMGNGYGRAGLCACPCPDGFAPAGALLCRRAARTVPRHSAAAAITRLYEGLPLAGARGVLATHQNARQVLEYRANSAVRARALAPEQALLVDAVCSQVDSVNPAAKRFCYEHACAQGRRSPLCGGGGGLQTPAGTGESEASVRRSLIRAAALLVTAALLTLWIHGKLGHK
jgi:hypothetical protein